MTQPPRPAPLTEFGETLILRVRPGTRDRIDSAIGPEANRSRWIRDTLDRAVAAELRRRARESERAAGAQAG